MDVSLNSKFTSTYIVIQQTLYRDISMKTMNFYDKFLYRNSIEIKITKFEN